MFLHRRLYTDTDLSLLQATLAEWIAAVGACGYGHIGDIPHRIYEVLPAHRAPELVQLWEHADRLLGFAICGLFGASFSMAAAPDLRGSDRELAMLQAACTITRRHMAADNPDEHRVNCDVYDCDSIRIAQLNRLGFCEYRIWDRIVVRDLPTALPPTRLPPGFRIRRATPDDCAGLADARNAVFDGNWTPESYRDAVMQKPGYDPAHEQLIVAPDGRIAAFAVLRLDSLNRVGQFEPVGTHPDFQRRGLARALLQHGLIVMQQHGMRSAFISYNAENQAAHQLYQRLGFEPRYTTLGFHECLPLGAEA
jgi:ribosomal protein S18 acetylase RimI-like enzyme